MRSGLVDADRDSAPFAGGTGDAVQRPGGVPRRYFLLTVASYVLTPADRRARIFVDIAAIAMHNRAFSYCIRSEGSEMADDVWCGYA